jgi:hypothetical protein
MPVIPGEFSKKELRVNHGPLIIQGRICRAKQLPFSWRGNRSSGTTAFAMVPMLPLLLIVLGAVPQISFASPSDATESQNSPGPEINGQDESLPGGEETESEFIELVTNDLGDHWKVFSSAPVKPDSPVWSVVPEGNDQELILICSGEPKGFLYTTQTCDEFELTLEWKYPKDADGNSGVLVYTQDEPRIWPTSMQVQLHQPKAGSVFPSGDATSDQSSENERALSRPVDTWNEGRIVSQAGRLSVEVNGQKAGEVTGAKPSLGSIALQSEGSVVHFRRIRLKKLMPEKPVKQAGFIGPARAGRR